MQLTVEINRKGKDNIIMSMSLQLGICGGLTLAIHCHQSLSVCSAPQSIMRGLGWKGSHAHLVPTSSPRVFSMLNSPSSLSLSIGDVLQLSDHLCVWPPLYLLWYVHVSLVLRTPQLGTAAQLGCHEGRVPSLDLLAGLLLLQPSVPECALVGSYVALHPQEPPCPSLQGCSQWLLLTALYSCLGLPWPFAAPCPCTCRTSWGSHEPIPQVFPGPSGCHLVLLLCQL